MIGPFGAIPTKSHLSEDVEAPKRVDERLMESAAGITVESTMSNNVSMQLGSAFVQRPRLSGDIAQIEDDAAERERSRKPVNTTCRVGCDNMGKLAYTIEDLMDVPSDLMGIEDAGRLAQVAVEGTIKADEDDDGVTFDPIRGFFVEAKKGKKKLRSAAEPAPGEFNSASGGTAPGKPEKIKVEGKQKLHPSMKKHTNSDAFKAHVGDNDDDEKPYHKGKGLQKEAADDGGEVPTKLQKKLRKNSPAYARPGEFDSASGGTAPGKKQKIKVEGSQSWKKISGKLKAGKKGAMARADRKQDKASGRPNPEGDFIRTGRDSGYNRKDPRHVAHQAKRGKKTKGLAADVGFVAEVEGSEYRKRFRSDKEHKAADKRDARNKDLEAQGMSSGQATASRRDAAHKARGKKTRSSGGCPPGEKMVFGKCATVKGEDFDFDPEHGFFVEAKDKARKQRSKENKARFAKLSPEAKAATKGDAPFHPEA